MAARSEQFAFPTVERRAAARRKLRIAAQLELVSSVRSVVMVNLSVAGACIEVGSPPAVGTPAVLSWGDNQDYCVVVWVAEQRCGLEFEIPIDQNVVDLAETAHLPSGPVARLLNIRAGRRRNRALAPDDLQQEPRTGWEWTVSLLHPRARGNNDRKLCPEEEMFLFGSPLAHLVTWNSR